MHLPESAGPIVWLISCVFNTRHAPHTDTPPLPMQLHSSNPTGSTTRFTFSVNYVATSATRPCGAMVVGSLSLTINAALGGDLLGVTFAGGHGLAIPVVW